MQCGKEKDILERQSKILQDEITKEAAVKENHML